MGNSFWRDGFGPLLPGTEAIPFNDRDALEDRLATKQFAAFVVEPIQSEAGITVPAQEYLKAAKALCQRYGTLLVLDEVQTGMYRTGRFLAAHHFGVDADMIILAKAMSGGLIPVSAVLMTEAICHSVYSSLRRAIIHTSTYSENSLAMRAALATIDVLESENLGSRSAEMGHLLRQRLSDELAGFEMVKEVRGEGLLLGIEFQPPKSLRLRIAFESFLRIHPAMFGQIIVMRLFRDLHILTQICGNNFMVLKVAPPLVVTEAQTEEFIGAVTRVVNVAHSSTGFWSEALGLARRAIGI